MISPPSPLIAFGLSAKVAIITGASAGIGETIATMLVTAGADVMIAARGADALERAAERLAAIGGGRIATMPADVRDPAQAAALVAATVERFGRLDILVNNAGKAWQAPLAKMTPEVWRNDIALNLDAAFHCSTFALPHLEADGGGSIVNISSRAGINGTMGTAAYSAAKAGLQMLTRVAAAEWGPRGIRVNAVAPGMIATPKALAAWNKVGFDSASASRAIPLRRPGRPEEIANAVLFLASPLASYISGETLAVDGGPPLQGMIDV